MLAALAAVIFLASGMPLFGQGHSNTGTASLGLTVSPADQLTITGGNTVNLKIRLGTGPAYLWGDSLSDCGSAPTIGSPTTISTSGIYTPALTAVPYNTASNDYVCVYDPGTLSLNTSVAWPHTGQKLVFNQSSIPNTAAGASITPAVTVQVQDSNGILVASSTASVTIGITSGTGTSGATLSGTLTQTAVNGVATFSNLSINKDGTGYSLTATSTGISNGTSSTFNITSGTATKVQVETAADGSGTVVPAQNLSSGSTLTVYAISRDASNNFVANVSATWSLVSVTGGVVSGDLSPASGTSATFTGHVIGTAVIHAVSGSLTQTNSGTITVTFGTAAKLAFTTQPSGGVVSTAFPTQPVVTVEDAGGNTVTGAGVSVTLAIGTNPGGGTLTCTGTGTNGTTFTTAASGVATATGCNIGPSGKAGTGYTLKATSGSLTQAISNPFDIDEARRSLAAYQLDPKPPIQSLTEIPPPMRSP